MQRKLIVGLTLLLVNSPLFSLGGTRGSLTLDDCITIALENNQALQINQFETQRSISQAKSNIGLVLPSINYSLSGSSSEIGSLGWNDRYSHSLSLTQNIWDGGRWWNTLKSAKLAQDLADIQFNSYELSTAYQVKVAFYNYLSTRKLLDVYR